MIRLTLIIAALCLLAGLANGIGDTLQFHYGSSWAADLDPQFWNPKVSLENKWAKDAQGELIYPLRPRYFGSSTFLVWTTDAWHLAKFFYHTLLRLAIVILLITDYTRRRVKEWSWWQYGVAYAVVFVGLAAIQAAGFHVFYTLL